jgi:hypothetical protein
VGQLFGAQAPLLDQVWQLRLFQIVPFSILLGLPNAQLSTQGRFSA